MTMMKLLLRAAAVSLLVAHAPAMAAATGGGDSNGETQPRSGYERAVELVETGDHEEAILILEELSREEPGNPDVHNMLGYAHRKLGRVEPAFEHYRRALAIEPRHLGANEYLGELYLETDQWEKAEERLAELAAACPSGCEEREELAEAIEAYKSERGLD